MTITQRKAQSYILHSIVSEDYNNKPLKGYKNKLKFLYETFKSEYGFNIQRYGEVGSFREWLMGLPSAISIVFTNYDIIQLAKKWGTLPKNATEKQEDRIIENYFNLIAVNAFQLFSKYKIQ